MKYFWKTDEPNAKCASLRPQETSQEEDMPDSVSVEDFRRKEILMEKETISRESIKIRENIVLPLLVIQQYALQKIGGQTDFKALYEKIVTRSLYGNINASRNSA